MYLPREKDYTVRPIIGDPGEVRFLRGDITKDPSDAIVNAANSELLAGGGVCGAIYRAAGPAIADDCRRVIADRGPLPAGQAVATTAGNLPARHVIHTVGPVWNGGNHREAEVLANCYRESVRVADALNLHTIAFPAISTGIFGYPLEEAAKVAIPSLIHVLASARHLVMASIVLFDKSALDAFARVALDQRDESGKSYEVAILHA